MVTLPAWLFWTVFGLAWVHLAVSFWVLWRWRVERAAAEMFERRWEGLLAEKEAGLDVRGKGILSGVPCGAPSGGSDGARRRPESEHVVSSADAGAREDFAACRAELAGDLIGRQVDRLAKLRAGEVPFRAILGARGGMQAREVWARLASPVDCQPEGVHLWRDVTFSGGLWNHSGERTAPDKCGLIFAVPCEPPSPEPDGDNSVPPEVRMCDL